MSQRPFRRPSYRLRVFECRRKRIVLPELIDLTHRRTVVPATRSPGRLGWLGGAGDFNWHGGSHCRRGAARITAAAGDVVDVGPTGMFNDPRLW